MYSRSDSGRSAGAGGAIPYRFSSKEMGNSHLQFEACRVLIGLLIDYFAEQIHLFRVGSELAYHLDADDLNSKVVPDLYILEDEPQGGPKVPSWKPWEHAGKVPTLAIEVVSDSYQKDYSPEEMPERYEKLGVRELVRYDPDYQGHRRGKYARHLFGHFLRDGGGQLVEQPAMEGSLRLRSYPLWLVHQPPYYLRLATGPSAQELTLLPTASERVRTMRDVARSEAERTRSVLEEANARADTAETELARLREELARLRGQG